MKRKRSKKEIAQEAVANHESANRLLALAERAKADLIASGKSVLTAEEWDLPSPERLRLVIERHEAERAAAKRARGNASD